MTTRVERRGHDASAMTALGGRIADRIARLGPITVAQYMAEVLADPAHGVYTSRDPLGAQGDFVTAPEISQMFGELIGLWCADTWARMGQPDPVHLVELGPGHGTLLVDALRALGDLGARDRAPGRAPTFLPALHLHLVEFSPLLRARQQAALAVGAGARVAEATWHESLDRVPEGPLLLIANEFFDALPIRQFERGPRGWCERLVILAPPGDRGRRELVFGLSEATPQIARLLPAETRSAPPGTIVEISSAAAACAGEVGRRLAARGGAALVIDYGYDRPRATASLQALRRHAAHGVLEQPGSADLTAHVDFSRLREAAVAAGARSHGPIPQGRFLAALGIDARAAALIAAATPSQAGSIEAALRRLTDPAEMGTHFKVLALTGPDLGPPAGFAQPASPGSIATC